MREADMTTDDQTSDTDILEDETRNLISDAMLEVDDNGLRHALEDIHPADFSDQLEQLSTEEREAFVERAGDLITANVLAELEDEVVEDILPRLPSEQIADAITELDNDDATQIVEEMEDEQREEVLRALEPEDRANLEASFEFDEETIGRLMQREFVAAPPFWTVGDTIDHMRQTGDDLPEVFFNIYIVDTAFHPVGYIPVSHLVRRKRAETLKSIMDGSLRIITQDMDQEDAAYLFEKYNLISAPVVDEAGRLSGIMTADDIIEIIQDENKEDILALAGAGDAGLTDTAFSTVKARAPWLFINLITAIIASLVIAQFDYAISQFVQLAILMPIVASMGGNAGTQSMTVTVRALATRDIDTYNVMRTIRRELFVGLLNGLFFAVLMGTIAAIWFTNTSLGLIVGLAMVVNMLCAALSGILIPITLSKLKIDPAIASSVFVTTVTDVVGFFAFLGLAAWWFAI